MDEGASAGAPADGEMHMEVEAPHPLRDDAAADMEDVVNLLGGHRGGVL